MLIADSCVPDPSILYLFVHFLVSILLLIHSSSWGKMRGNPLSMTTRRVDLTGDPSDAWWKVSKSSLVVSARMMALYDGRSDDVDLSPFKLTSHILFGHWLCPTRMMLFLFLADD